VAPVLLISELDGVVCRFEPRFFDRLREMLDRVVLTADADEVPDDEDD
jgi:hypothetical protein